MTNILKIKLSRSNVKILILSSISIAMFLIIALQAGKFITSPEPVVKKVELDKKETEPKDTPFYYQERNDIGDMKRELARYEMHGKYNKFNSINSKTPFKKVVGLIDRSQIDEAEAILDSILKKAPHTQWAYLELAMIELFNRKNPVAANNYLWRLLELNPDNSFAIKELVTIYRHYRRFQEGINDLQEFQSRHPNAYVINHYLGQLYLSKGEPERAILYFDSAQKNTFTNINSADHAIFMIPKGYALEKLGNLKSALKFYIKASNILEKQIRDKIITGEPVELYTQKLNSLQFYIIKKLIKNNEVNKAEPIFRRLAERIPNDPKVITLLEKFRMKNAG